MIFLVLKLTFNYIYDTINIVGGEQMNQKELLRYTDEKFSIEHRFMISPLNMKISHFHEHYEILYISKSHRTLHANNKLYTLHDNAIALIPPKLQHRAESPQNVHQERCLINFTKEFIGDIAETLESDIFQCFSHENPVKVGRDTQIAVIKNILNDLHIVHTQYNGAYRQDMLRLHLCRLLEECSQLDNANPTNINSISDRMIDIINHIDLNYDREITLDTLEAEFNVDKFLISRNFHEYKGITFNKYLNKVRIDNAIKLLKNTNHSILDISLSCGFNNVSHFSKIFRSLTGKSPMQYRKSMKESDE